MVFLIQSTSVKSQTVWTDTFLNGNAPTPVQVAAWTTFISRLDTTKCFTSMTISGTFDQTGITCTDPAIVSAFAKAMKKPASYTSPVTNGNVWSICSRYQGEVWLNPPSECSGNNCPTGYMIRPGIGNSNWGGVNTATCGGPNQRMTFTFEYAEDHIEESICMGDSFLFYGNYLKTPGQYTETYSTGTCDSTINLTLIVDTLPTVTLGDFSEDTVCDNGGLVSLPAGSPSNGTYSGNGVTGTSFNPLSSGLGSHYIVYTYIDSNSCSASDSTMITVVNCVGIDEDGSKLDFSIYPNPNNGIFEITLSENVSGEINVRIYDLNGRMILSDRVRAEAKLKLDLGNIQRGSYFIELQSNQDLFTKKLLIQ